MAADGCLGAEKVQNKSAAENRNDDVRARERIHLGIEFKGISLECCYTSGTE